jgi:hypothetical protein
MNEKLIKYFSGEMSASEMEDFEKTVMTIPSLQEEFKKYRSFFSGINETRNPDVKEDYFIDLIPKFRAKLDYKRKKRYHPVFSFASAILTVIVVLLFIPHTEKVIKENNANATNYSASEITDYLSINSEQPIITNLPADVEANYDSVLDNMIYNELDINEQNLVTNDLIGGLDYNTLLQSVDPNEAAIIYEKLKSKKNF